MFVPDLGLELVNEGLHPLVVLPVLLLLEGELLDPPFASAQVLLRIAVAAALSVQLRLQLPIGLVGWVMDQISIKTSNTKCRLYWCLIEFID